MKQTFEEMMAVANRLADGQNRLRDTILKEVLHTDILQALHQSEFGKSLVFQGGTALRLCYGNGRYSEDLDFVRSQPLDPAQFATFKQILQALIAEKYALNVRLPETKQPLDTRTTPDNVVVHRWKATIEIEKPGTRNQKIHIEVSDSASRCGMKLFLVDYHLEAARWGLTFPDLLSTEEWTGTISEVSEVGGFGEVGELCAKDHLARAEALMAQTGYAAPQAAVAHLREAFHRSPI